MSGQRNNAGDCPHLMEVALPIREISAESVRDKCLQHGHFSAPHLWWARKPLAASRAVVLASLVAEPDDPSGAEAFQEGIDQNLKTRVRAERECCRRGSGFHCDEHRCGPHLSAKVSAPEGSKLRIIRDQISKLIPGTPHRPMQFLVEERHWARRGEESIAND